MSSPIIKNESKPSSPLLPDKADIQNSLISDTANYFEEILTSNNGKNCAPENRNSKKNGCKKRWFTAHEKSVLQRLVLDNESVILSRRNDGVSVHLKKEVWLGIAEKFNNHPQTLTQRNSVELRRCWENMKFKAKKTLHRVQRHIEAARASSQCLGLPFTAGASPRAGAESIIGLTDVFSPRHMDNVVENSVFDNPTSCHTKALEVASKDDSVEDLNNDIKSDDQVKVSVFNSSSSVMSISPFFCLSSATVPENINVQSRNNYALSPSNTEPMFVTPLNLSCDATFLTPDTALKVSSQNPISYSKTTLEIEADSQEILKNATFSVSRIDPQNCKQSIEEKNTLLHNENNIDGLLSNQANLSHHSACNSPSRMQGNGLDEGNLDTCSKNQDSEDVLQQVAAQPPPPLLPAMSALFSVLEGQTLSLTNRPPVMSSACLPDLLPCSTASSDALDVCLDLSTKSHVRCVSDSNEHELNDDHLKFSDRNVLSPLVTRNSDCAGNENAKYGLCEDPKNESESQKSAFNWNNIYFSYSPFGLDIHYLPSSFGPLSGTNAFRLNDANTNAALANVSVLRNLLSSSSSRTLFRSVGHDTEPLKTDGNWISSVPPRVTTGKPLNCDVSLNNYRRDGGESLVFNRLLETLNNMSKPVPEEKFSDPVQCSDKSCGDEGVNTKSAPLTDSRLVSEHIIAENIIFENTLLCQRLRLLQEQLQEVSGEHLQKMRLMQEEHRERLALFHEELSMKRMACQVMLEKALRSAK